MFFSVRSLIHLVIAGLLCLASVCHLEQTSLVNVCLPENGLDVVIGVA